MVKDVVRLFDGALVGIGDVPADIETLVSNLITDAPGDSTSGAEAFRSRLASALVVQARQSSEPALINFVRTQVGSPETEIQAVLSRLYDDLVANAELIKSRGITYGPAAPDGGNTGGGVIYRLVEDSQGYDLEATHVDTKTLRCVADQTTGAVKHQEQFRIDGQRAGVDAIEILGSGVGRQDAATRSKVSTDSELANCGFESFSLGSASFAAGIAALTSDSIVTGWELLNAGGAASDPTLFELDQNAAAQARELEGAAAPTSLRMTALSMIRQALSVNGVNLADGNPYMTVLAVKPENSADGSIVVTWGNKTQTITVASLSAGVWNKIPLDRDLDLWPASFNEEDPVFSVEWTGRTTGELVLDELEALVPMFGFDGLWYHTSGEVGPTANKWLQGDKILFADALAGSDSQFQQLLFRLFGRHLPHSGTPSAAWAEPF